MNGRQRTLRGRLALYIDTGRRSRSRRRLVAKFARYHVEDAPTIAALVSVGSAVKAARAAAIAKLKAQAQRP